MKNRDPYEVLYWGGPAHGDKRRFDVYVLGDMPREASVVRDGHHSKYRIDRYDEDARVWIYQYAGEWSPLRRRYEWFEWTVKIYWARLLRR